MFILILTVSIRYIIFIEASLVRVKEERFVPILGLAKSLVLMTVVQVSTENIVAPAEAQ